MLKIKNNKVEITSADCKNLGTKREELPQEWQLGIIYPDTRSVTNWSLGAVHK